MTDCIIDTNVLLVASALDPTSPFDDSEHVSPEAKQKVFDWLKEFRDDAGRSLVLDQTFRIWDEYHNKLSRGQDYGSHVVTDKLQRSAVRFHEIEFDADGHGVLPAELERVIHDRSDRKFVATALADISKGDTCVIVNAVDRDWCEWTEGLSQYGIVVHQLVDGLCDEPDAAAR